MDPADLSARLRSVADRVDASRRPSLSLVAAELRSILASVAGEDKCTCAPGVVNAACPVHGDGYEEPKRVSAALRSISQRILASKSPSRSAVARELRRVLASMDQGQVSAGPTKVFVSEDWWDVNQVRELMEEVGGSDLRECEYGLYGFVAPAAAASKLQSEPGVSAVDSWEEANGTDPNVDFQPVDGEKSPPVDL